MYVSFAPRSPALAPYVATLWYQRSPAATGLERVFPTGCGGLHVNLTEADIRVYRESGAVLDRASPMAIQGPTRRSQLISPGELGHCVGVGFRPGGLFPFTAIPASELSDRLVSLDQVWGLDAWSLYERLRAAADPGQAVAILEDALLARLRRPLWPGLAAGVAALGRNTPATAVAEALGMTPKRLRAVFGEQVGLGPKTIGRLGRFQRLLADAAAQPDGDWGRRAVSCGYYDQPHLIHEFREFTGLSPGRYRPRSAEERNHMSV